MYMAIYTNAKLVWQQLALRSQKPERSDFYPTLTPQHQVLQVGNPAQRTGSSWLLTQPEIPELKAIDSRCTRLGAVVSG